MTHQGRDRRRPGADARRVQHDPRRPAGHRRGRRRRERSARRRAVPTDPSRRRADGHPDAGPRRHRGDPADHVGRRHAPPRCSCSRRSISTSTCTPPLRAGASGYLLKDTPAQELVAAVRVIAQGEALLSPSVTRAADRGVRPPARARGTVARVAARRPHRPRAGGARAAGPRAQQPRDRGPDVHRRGHGQDPRQPAAHEARGARSGPGRRARLRDRPRPPGRPNEAVGRLGWVSRFGAGPRRAQWPVGVSDLCRGPRRALAGGFTPPYGRRSGLRWP